MPDPKLPKAGDPISAETIRWLIERVKALEAMTVTAPLKLTNVGGKRAISLSGIADQVLTVKLTSQDSEDPSKYAWKQVFRKADGWEEPENARTGTLASDPAYHLDPENEDDLTDSFVCIARVPMLIDGTTRRGWIIIGSPPASCSIEDASTIGSSVLGSEAADEAEWTRDDGTPAEVWIETRQRYYSSGDEKWYAYARKFTYSSCGTLYSISGETRIEVDAPDEC